MLYFLPFSGVLVFYTYVTTHWVSCSESPVKHWDDGCQMRWLSMQCPRWVKLNSPPLLPVMILLTSHDTFPSQSRSWTPILFGHSLYGRYFFSLIILLASLSSFFKFYCNLLDTEEPNQRHCLQVLCRFI